MKPIFYFLLTAALSLNAAGCAVERVPNVSSHNADTSNTDQAPPASLISADESTEHTESGIQFTLTAGEQTFAFTLEDNQAAQEFSTHLPLSPNMSELNGNEKYFYMDNSFTTDSYRPGEIHAGDLMLYGDNCVVLFYKSFSSSYSYTRLGRVNDPEGLAAALGAGTVTVTFSAEGNP